MADSAQGPATSWFLGCFSHDILRVVARRGEVERGSCHRREKEVALSPEGKSVHPFGSLRGEVQCAHAVTGASREGEGRASTDQGGRMGGSRRTTLGKNITASMRGMIASEPHHRVGEKGHLIG